MQRNNVHSVTVISSVALELGVEEDLQHEVSLGMNRKDGVIWVEGLGADGIMAFTGGAADELRNLLDFHGENSEPSK